MSRFLFITLPLPGHVNPISATAAALSRLGHEVVWAGSESFLRPSVGPDAIIHPIPLRAHRGQAERGLDATRSRWQGYIVPHARTTLPGIEAAIGAYRPDVLAVDQHALAGAVAAHRYGLPWAGLAPTTMELTRPLLTLPRVEDWIGEQMETVWTAAGMPGTTPHDLRFSPHLLIAYTGRALVGDLPVPANAELVGPSIAPRPDTTGFPWEWLDPGRQHLLVTVGTLSMDISRSFYQRMLGAVAPLGDRLQVVVVAPEGAITDPPPHVLVRTRVPALDLIPRMDAVVSHGGLNTVCETLAEGVPLVIAPIKGDQPVNAAQVAAAGAGLRVSFEHATAAALRTAFLTVIGEPAYRAAATRIQESFAGAGGAETAARLLGSLAARTGGASTTTAADRAATDPTASGSGLPGTAAYAAVDGRR